MVRSSDQPRARSPLPLRTCEDGCGCTFRAKDGYLLAIDGVEHYFCCSDCAEGYAGHLASVTSVVLRKNVRMGNTVVDAGCGTGYYTEILSKLVGPAGHVLAVDSKKPILRLLQERVAKSPSRGNVRVCQASVDDLAPVEDHSVDFLLSNTVLCCVRWRMQAVKEIARVLRPGGKAYVRIADMKVTGIHRISAAEWTRLLSVFKVLESGGSDGIRWAIVGPSPPHRPRNDRRYPLMEGERLKGTQIDGLKGQP